MTNITGYVKLCAFVIFYINKVVATQPVTPDENGAPQESFLRMFPDLDQQMLFMRGVCVTGSALCSFPEVYPPGSDAADIEEVFGFLTRLERVVGDSAPSLNRMRPDAVDDESSNILQIAQLNAMLAFMRGDVEEMTPQSFFDLVSRFQDIVQGICEEHQKSSERLNLTEAYDRFLDQR